MEMEMEMEMEVREAGGGELGEVGGGGGEAGEVGEFGESLGVYSCGSARAGVACVGSRERIFFWGRCNTRPLSMWQRST
jgi:hypothetical protein